MGGGVGEAVVGVGGGGGDVGSIPNQCLNENGACAPVART